MLNANNLSHSAPTSAPPAPTLELTPTTPPYAIRQRRHPGDQQPRRPSSTARRTPGPRSRSPRPGWNRTSRARRRSHHASPCRPRTSPPTARPRRSASRSRTSRIPPRATPSPTGPSRLRHGDLYPVAVRRLGPSLAASTVVIFQIDNTTPTSVSDFRLNPADDTGISGDDVTTDRTPVFIGTTTPGYTVELFVNGQTAVQTTAVRPATTEHAIAGTADRTTSSIQLPYAPDQRRDLAVRRGDRPGRERLRPPATPWRGDHLDRGRLQRRPRPPTRRCSPATPRQPAPVTVQTRGLATSGIGQRAPLPPATPGLAIGGRHGSPAAPSRPAFAARSGNRRRGRQPRLDPPWFGRRRTVSSHGRQRRPLRRRLRRRRRHRPGVLQPQHRDLDARTSRRTTPSRAPRRSPWGRPTPASRWWATSTRTARPR